MKRQSCHHIETSQMICSENQLTGFYMMATLAFNELILEATFSEDRSRYIRLYGYHKGKI